jgi:hypothetical protein
LLFLFPNQNYAVKIIKQKFKSKFAYRKIVISIWMNVWLHPMGEAGFRAIKQETWCEAIN